MPYGLPRTAPSLPTILIVDDAASEAMTLDLLCRCLGVETMCTASTAEAAVVLEWMRSAGIITDLVMPAADGLDCLFMIAELHAPTMPVMAVTASACLFLKATGELAESCSLSDQAYVAKPVDLGIIGDRAGEPFRPLRTPLH